MHTFPLHFTLVLFSSCTRSHAELDNFFLPDSSESTLNQQLDDTSWNSNGFASSLPDFALNPVNQGEVNLFSDANDLLAGMNLVDLASLPDSCGSEESSSDKPIQARDRASCASRNEQIDLPLDLFKDPKKYLLDNLHTPPVGQAGQSGQGNEDGDMGFADFMRNRDASFSAPPNPDERVCDPERFSLATTPMCSNPYTGSVDPNVNFRNSFTLTDAVPCKSLIRLLFWGVIPTYLKRR